MSAKRIVGLILVVVGLVALLWGGVFWTDRDTLLDAGPVQITRDEREGFSVPPAVGNSRGGGGNRAAADSRTAEGVTE